MFTVVEFDYNMLILQTEIIEVVFTFFVCVCVMVNYRNLNAHAHKVTSHDLKVYR